MMQLDFNKTNGLIPAVIQHAQGLQVLMLGYMNKEALEATQNSGKVTFFSRSKQRLWTKGESSGHFLIVQEIKADCDGDTLLIKAIPQGPTCHLGTPSCFGDEDSNSLNFLLKLQEVIKDRHQNPRKESYTSSLFAHGSKISQKVGEEAVEVVIEGIKGDRNQLMQESADLLYHLMILWEQQGTSLQEVAAILESRH